MDILFCPLIRVNRDNSGPVIINLVMLHIIQRNTLIWILPNSEHVFENPTRPVLLDCTHSGRNVITTSEMLLIRQSVNQAVDYN